MKWVWITVPVFLAGLLAIWIFLPEKEIDFNTQIKPIINKNCIVCHGGVRRKAGFSLLFRNEALAAAESGKFPIVPGKPEPNKTRQNNHHPRSPIRSLSG